MSETFNVRVWLARPEDLDDRERRVQLLSLLSGDERRRFEAFRFERDRDLFLTAHALLRLALSREADVSPETWRFDSGANGRPEIAGPSSALRFSVSHTHGLAACAVTRDTSVGIDVEDLQRPAPLDLLPRYFSPSEAEAIEAALPAERTTRFFEHWTLKEAFLKALGVGLSVPLEQISFYRDASRAWQVEFARLPTDDLPSNWRFLSWRVRGTHQAALAVRHSGAEEPTVAVEEMRPLA